MIDLTKIAQKLATQSRLFQQVLIQTMYAHFGYLVKYKNKSTKFKIESKRKWRYYGHKHVEYPWWCEVYQSIGIALFYLLAVRLRRKIYYRENFPWKIHN